MVVYGPHGAGPISARETRIVSGERREVIVLTLENGLSVALPLERARKLLRPLADEAALARVQSTLGADETASTDTWLKRRQNSLAKLSTGDPVGLAEIIRDCASRESTTSRTGAKATLSPGERELSTKARQLLSIEIALVRGLEQGEANTWIDEQLARTR
jgi:RNA polymerase-interacting CarD/CdnL/TRCF family regulator